MRKNADVSARGETIEVLRSTSRARWRSRAPTARMLSQTRVTARDGSCSKGLDKPRRDVPAVE